ncbi:MAG: putative toxin-antitoxin system toxin component, PIN family [Spirochaetes bacterium]|nr:putative toxin-antitoxin system toxin component, PIN family [Spirochaetota bacterium]
MTVVLDTTVLYQALRSQGASYYILSLVRQGQIEMVLSTAVLFEYQEVLSRPANLRQFDLKKTQIESFLAFISYIAKPVAIHFTYKPNLRDETDNKFIELALNGQADYLITSNIVDFKNRAELKLATLKIVTPAKFLKIWRQKHEN